MKKAIMIVLMTILPFSLIGCSANGTSVKEQKEVVIQFFDYIKNNQLGEANELGTDSYENFFSDTTISFEMYFDKERYGEDFVTEARRYQKVVFANLIKEYSIIDAKENGDKTTITVTGKRLETKSLPTIDINSEAEELINSYQSDHSEEIQKNYIEKGEIATMKEIYSAIAMDFFEIYIRKVETLTGSNFALSITLVKEKDKWKIDEIRDASE